MTQKIIWYTFLAVVIYLAVTQPKGVKIAFEGVTGLYSGAVEALQGRSKPS